MTSSVGAGLFHAWNLNPLNRHQLQRMVPVTKARLFRRAQRRPWLPAELLAVINESDPRNYNQPLHRAALIPPELVGRP